MNCKEFIEKAVDIKNALNELEKAEPDGVQLCTVSRSGVQIFNNINILADRLGIQLKCKTRDDKQYPYKYYFCYGDTLVFEIDDDRWYQCEIEEEKTDGNTL